MQQDERETSLIVTDTQQNESHDDYHSSDTEYKVVKRRHRYLAMIPAGAITDNKPYLPNLIVDIKQALHRKAFIQGTPRMEFHTASDEATLEPMVVFEVGSSEELDVTTRCGFNKKDEEGQIIKIYFQKYTATHYQAIENRKVIIKSLAWNTKEEAVHVAMSRFGAVAQITMGFNALKTMAIATVLFQTLEPVQRMIEEDITYITLGNRDTGAIAQRGKQTIQPDTTLTKKLVKLPPTFMPLDVVELLNTIQAPNGVRSFQAVTMPVNPRTKQRLPEAFVYFENTDQWERVKNVVFSIEGGYNTAWVTTDIRTCYTCASPDHKNKECPVLQRRHQRAYARKLNTQLIAGVSTYKQAVQRVKANSNTPATSTSQKSSTTTTPSFNTHQGSTMDYRAALKGNKEKGVVKKTPTMQLPGTSANNKTQHSKEKVISTEYTEQLEQLEQQLAISQQKWETQNAQITNFLARMSQVEAKISRIEQKLDTIGGHMQLILSNIGKPTHSWQEDEDSEMNPASSEAAKQKNNVKGSLVKETEPATVTTTIMKRSLDTVNQSDVLRAKMGGEQAMAHLQERLETTSTKNKALEQEISRSNTVAKHYRDEVERKEKIIAKLLEQAGFILDDNGNIVKGDL